jgi:hypothetical protein
MSVSRTTAPLKYAEVYCHCASCVAFRVCVAPSSREVILRRLPGEELHCTESEADPRHVAAMDDLAVDLALRRRAVGEHAAL